MNDFWKNVKALFDMQSELDVQVAAEHIKSNVNFKGMNLYILVCAIIIASLGLNVNSTAVIIGAMLISPLMSPIIGFGLSVGTDDIQLMRHSLKNLAIMTVISIIASSLFFLVTPLNMQHPSELLARTNPTIYDVLIALVGGIAGALENSRKNKGTVISGVAIATALMPPLCTVGYGIANLDIRIAGGAFYLFFINCVFVALATFFVVKYLRFPKVSHINDEKQHRARFWTTAFLIVLIIPSVLSAVTVIRENNFKTNADIFVQKCKPLIQDVVIYDYATDPHDSPASVTLYLAGKKLSDSERESIFSLAEEEFGINRHQIKFESAILAGESSEMEKQVYSDMNTRIAQLNSELQEYKSMELPHEQIEKEFLALYPAISSIKLARGKDCIYAIINCSDPVTNANLANLEKWLEIRLGNQDVEILNTWTEE